MKKESKGDSKPSQTKVAGASFTKDAFKKASNFSKFVTYSWAQPFITAANNKVDCGFKDFPDLTIEGDDITPKIEVFEEFFCLSPISLEFFCFCSLIVL